jgi:hypothetical protein
MYMYLSAMIRTTFVLLGLLAAVSSAFVPSARPSLAKSLLRVSEFLGWLSFVLRALIWCVLPSVSQHIHNVPHTY